MTRSRYVPLALVAAGVLLASCDQGRIGDPLASPDYVPVARAGLLSACQLAPEVEFTGSAGLLGGKLSGGGVTMSIPVGALLSHTEFRFRIPSSPYAEVEIQANGQEHHQFLLPVVISIDYSRCQTSTNVLTAWHIDPDTKALLENMGGVNDVENRRVTFSTMHLSGYAIAN